VLKFTYAPFAQGADGIKIFRASLGLSTSYLYQYLLFKPVKMEEYKRHFSIFKRKLIAFPGKKSEEQQKIAVCLSSIDDLITAQTQKLGTLKTHKKALMQQLFPAVDHNHPTPPEEGNKDLLLPEKN
jgi:type I restriction enzyme S subunit